MSDKKDKYSWLVSIISGWGLSQSWAKLIAGAIIGALCACGFLSSCSPLSTEQAQIAISIIEVMTADK